MVLRRGQMTQDVRDAAVAIEDRRFYFHHGVRRAGDPPRRRTSTPRPGTVVEGGSTITQQLVKNLYVGAAETLPSQDRRGRRSPGSSRTASRRTRSSRSTSTPSTSARAPTAWRPPPRPTSRIPADALTLAQSAMLAGLDHRAEPLRSVRPDPVGTRPSQRGPAADADEQEMITTRRVPRTPVTSRSCVAARDDPSSATRTRTSSTTSSNGSSGTRRSGHTREDAGQAPVHRRPPYHDHARAATCRTYAQTRGSLRARLSERSRRRRMTVLDPRTGYVRAMVGGEDADYWKDPTPAA